MGKPLLVCLVIVGALGAGAMSTVACGSDDETVRRTSRRGEACQVSGDCADGLACVPVPVPGVSGGICVTGEFHVRPTAKDCTIVECAMATDCCDGTQAAGCASLRVQCEAERDAGGLSGVCAEYQLHCGCDNGTIDCQLGKCVSRCSLDRDCVDALVGLHCSGGTCVQCTSDPECGGGRQCVNGACEAACTNDGDCSGFDRCLNSRCIASGCQADRECVATTRNVDARCGTDGKCIVPCATDLECGNPTSYSFFSCIEHECTYVGCESDKDCRLFLFGPTDASVLGKNQHAVCRDRGAIGDVPRTTP